MPRITGINILAVIVAALAYYFVGFLIYGVLFPDLWQSLMGYQSREALEAAYTGHEWKMAISWIMPLVTTIVLAILMRGLGARGAIAGAKLGFLTWAGFAATTTLYAYVYQTYPVGLVLMDWAHMLIGYCIAGAILGAWRARDLAANTPDNATATSVT